ncbi:mannose-1-phosphate guanylyltransferase/mannose-6-phosphate isomerase [Desulfovibrio sp. JC010]|uniref:mannose-1-phosphate guanylyltransferase/mannose-6-phosphate isomerase n=1 Tax=Desulfovibrio sp. JC010 TaxID=2593641 RepID=UPI0013D0D757|nr:mannose-1-phosphate guanylyltransferase/mannose-6-phosphate isomerase [Desulfovibrio sp. JC010]NDV26658.1 mannose-1-phosphate guanylyltransferase/mannose-6-phosphate isomerase [Desulfovibrio sp. JC010]
MIIPVILSGGSGTRLWPLSRKKHPKQLLNLTGEHSLLRNTVERGCALDSATAPIVVCNESYRFLIAEELREANIQPEAIFLEPQGRNSAPAIAAAAFHIRKNHPEALMLVMPSDHAIHDLDRFEAAVTAGTGPAKSGDLVLFGIVPDRPETGYGYIRTSKEFDPIIPQAVREFVEKPDLDTAKTYLKSGNYLWNSGIFLFSPDVFLKHLDQLEPEMHTACRNATENARVDLDFVRLEEESFKSSPAKSVDYAVIEKVENLSVVPFDGGWSDIGSWDSLMTERRPDENGNVISGDVHAKNVANSFLQSSSRLVGVVGVDDVIVVETPDAVLVAGREHGQEVSGLVAELKKQERSEVDHHRRVYRPWGSYETVDLEERFQVKRIIVKPGGVLSLQMHHHRAEHWVVVKGTAKVLVGEKEVLLQEDQSTYIPIGAMHRLENPGRINLELIEVQTGSYLGEDDIQRFEDIYGRSEG